MSDKELCEMQDCGFYNGLELNNCGTLENIRNCEKLAFKYRPAEAVTAVDTTLTERGEKYGSYPEQCRITQNIKRAMVDSPNWAELSDDKKEALEMIALKIGRILNGDPEYADSWHDIAGYAKLVEDSLS